MGSTTLETFAKRFSIFEAERALIVDYCTSGIIRLPRYHLIITNVVLILYLVLFIAITIIWIMLFTILMNAW